MKHFILTLSVLFTMFTSQAFGAASIVPAFGCFSTGFGKICAGQTGTNTMHSPGFRTEKVGGKPTLTVLSQPVDITDSQFGAVANDTSKAATNTTAINAAITYAVNQKRPLHIPGGTFWVTNVIALQTNLTMLGVGQGVSSIKLVANSGLTDGNTAVLMGTDVSNVKIAHLTVDGNYQNQTGAPVYGICNILFIRGSHNEVFDVEVKNSSREGVQFQGSTYSRINNCYGHDNINSAFNTAYDPTGLVMPQFDEISNNTAYNNGTVLSGYASCITINGPYNTVEGNMILYCGISGINAGHNAPYNDDASNFVIKGNIIGFASQSLAAGGGIGIPYAPNGGIVEHNVIFNSGNQGISSLYSSGVGKLQVLVNYITGSTLEGIALSHIADLVLNGNESINNGKDNIRLTACGPGIVSSNILKNAASPYSGLTFNTAVSDGLIITNNIATDDQTIKTQSFGLNAATGIEPTNTFFFGNRFTGNATGNTSSNMTFAEWLGIGTFSPSARIHAIGTGEQLRLGYDASNYASFQTGSNGSLTVSPSGGDLQLYESTSGGVVRVGKATGDNGQLRVRSNGNDIVTLGDTGSGNDGTLVLYASDGTTMNAAIHGNGNSFVNANSGNFCVGNTTCNEKLAITGSLSYTTFLKQTIGSNVASATSITPSASLFHITGTSAISTISLPFTGFTGCLKIIPDGIFTTNTSGNIALASTAIVSKILEVCYDGTKWYPSY